MTAGTSDEGGECNVVTTADAVTPGVVRESKRSIWELSQLEIYDGGRDNDAETTGDNSPFATQGVFVP